MTWDKETSLRWDGNIHWKRRRKESANMRWKQSEIPRRWHRQIRREKRQKVTGNESGMWSRKADGKVRRSEGENEENREWKLREDIVETGTKHLQQSQADNRERREENRLQREEKWHSQRWRNYSEIEGNHSESLSRNTLKKWRERQWKITRKPSANEENGMWETSTQTSDNQNKTEWQNGRIKL